MDLNVSSVNVANSYSVDKRQNIGFKGNLYRVPIKQELEFARFKLGQKTETLMTKIRKFFGIKSLKEKYGERNIAKFEELNNNGAMVDLQWFYLIPKHENKARSIYKRLKDTVLKNFTAEERYNMDKDTFTKFVQEAVEKGIITKKEGKQIIQSRSFQ